MIQLLIELSKNGVRHELYVYRAISGQVLRYYTYDYGTMRKTGWKPNAK